MMLFIVRSKWQDKGREQTIFMATEDPDEARDYAADEAGEPGTVVQTKTIEVDFDQ